MRRTNQKRTAAGCLAVVLLAIVAIVVLLWTHERPAPISTKATLHEEGDAGYIPVAADGLDVTLDASHAFVYDCSRGEILYQKGSDEVLYPASTTKLLTILCALEHLSPTDVITPGPELSLVKAGSSIAYIKSHHALTVEMLVEGMLLPSGNDATYVLAAAAGHRIDPTKTGAEAIAVFLEEMEEYGKSIGLVGTHFTTPDGYSDQTHYSTVEDMILIARLAMQNDLVRRYAAMHEDGVIYASGHTNHWVNTNEMLDPDSPWYHEAVTGLKTGSLDRNYCLICTVELDGHAYIIGLFGARKKTMRYTDALTVIDALLEHGEVAR